MPDNSTFTTSALWISGQHSLILLWCNKVTQILGIVQTFFDSTNYKRVLRQYHKKYTYVYNNDIIPAQNHYCYNLILTLFLL